MVGHLVEDGGTDLVSQLPARQSQVEVRPHEDDDAVGQVAAVVHAAFEERHALVDAEETLPGRVLCRGGPILHYHVEVLDRVEHPLGQGFEGFVNDAFELGSSHGRSIGRPGAGPSGTGILSALATGESVGEAVVMTLEIRSARPGDAPAIAKLAEQLGYAPGAAAVAERLSAVLADPGQAVLVAMEGERVIGWAQIRSATLLQVSAFAELSGLVVAEDRRSGGLGAHLLAAAEAWAAERGFGEMRVRSNAVRARAHGFYEQRGYRIEKTSLSFIKEI